MYALLMKIAVVIFTCLRDRFLAAEAARRLVGPDVSVTMCFDEKESVPSDTVPEGVRLSFSRWPRRGNLNGKECVIGILAELQRAATEAGAEWACKVDSDTLVNPKFFALLARPGADAVGFHAKSRGWYGACYAMRARILPKLFERAEKLPVSPELKYPEDVTMGGLLLRCGFPHQKHNLAWKNNVTNAEVPIRYLAVCFGYMNGMPAPFLTDAQRREEVLRRMKAYSFTRQEGADVGEAS